MTSKYTGVANMKADMIYGMKLVKVLLIIPFLVSGAKSEDVANDRKVFELPYSERYESTYKAGSARNGGFVGYFRAVGVEFKGEPVIVLDTEKNLLRIESDHKSAVDVMRFMGLVERRVVLKKTTAADQALKKERELLIIEKDIERELKHLRRQVNFVGSSIMIGSKVYRKGDVLELKLSNKSRQLRVLKFTRKKVEFYDEVSNKVRVWDLIGERIYLRRHGDEPKDLSRAQETQMKMEIEMLRSKVNVFKNHFLEDQRIYKIGDFYTVSVFEESYRLKIISISKERIVFLNEHSKITYILDLKPPIFISPRIEE